ncbi:MAG: SDR family NAD(P)-dependent oxidoreductase, partial [Bacteroidota bacterium]
MDRLDKKVALVSGAADGIGLAITKAFVREGAQVAMCDINVAKCDQEANTLLEQGGKVTSYACDVGITKDVQNAVTRTLDDFGRIDILVNNAAVGIM